MNTSRSDNSQPVLLLLTLAAGFVMGALSFGAAASHDSPSTATHRAAPTAFFAASVARLDDGVDWSRVAAAENSAPLAVAAYDR